MTILPFTSTRAPQLTGCTSSASTRLAMADLSLFVVRGALGLMRVVVLLLGVILWLTQEESERVTQNPDLKKLLRMFLREIAGLVRWLVYPVLALAGLFVAARFVKRLFVAA